LSAAIESVPERGDAQMDGTIETINRGFSRLPRVPCPAAVHIPPESIPRTRLPKHVKDSSNFIMDADPESFTMEGEKTSVAGSPSLQKEIKP
jgi:hypothetical protein